MKLQDFVASFEFRFDGAKSISLSINDAKEHVARVMITPAALRIQKDDHDHDGPVLDSHAQAHADDIARRFGKPGQEVTTGQIVVFGLTGGLIPCPASITVLLLCLQLKQVALGATLVLGFSLGLALTMVASGALAALSVRHAARHWGGFGKWADKAPYLSVVLMLLVAAWMAWEGWHGLATLG